MTDRSGFQNFTGELRRRHVPQTAAVYLVAAWAAIQFADIVVPNLNGPQWAVTAVIVAAGVGFPVVLILAWIFDWGPEGIHRTGPEEDPVGAEAGGGGVAGSRSAAPWMAAVAVLAVGIGSALAVAALLMSQDDTYPANAGAADAGGDADTPRRPGPPPVLVPSDFDGDLDSLRRSTQRDLSNLRGLGRIEDLGLFDGVDTMDLGELVDVAARIAEEAGLSVLIEQPPAWRIGRRAPAPLAQGDTLRISGIARDTAGVVSVAVDGQTVTQVAEPVETLRFRGRVAGVGSEGIRTVVVVVRTGDGREIRREYPIAQRPAGSAPDNPSGTP